MMAAHKVVALTALLETYLSAPGCCFRVPCRRGFIAFPHRRASRLPATCGCTKSSTTASGDCPQGGLVDELAQVEDGP
jgi:hypothetical protein